MQIDINGRGQNLFFGLDFIEQLDKKFKMDTGGVNFGVGVMNALVSLEQANPLILVDIIQAATSTNDNPPGKTEVKRWLEGQDDIEWLFTDFLTELEQAPMTRTIAKRMKKATADRMQATDETE